jgi:FKBP-type peptidyl-prolyl cis-trans isomerase
LGLNHGAKAYLFMPPSLGYGDQASGPVPANAELIFYIEIQ